MMYAIVFVQFTIFIASYVYCARLPPVGFFHRYSEEKCFKLDHRISHVNHLRKSAVAMDMICETEYDYDLASFAALEPDIVHISKDTMGITKIDQNLTVINFGVENERGVVTLYFETIEDTKNFNRNFYPQWRDSLEHIQTIGGIESILNSTPYIYTVATRFADIYVQRDSNPKKFVVEADGIPEPALVFVQGEFKLTIDPRKEVYQTLLKLGDTIYEMVFESDEERKKFADEMGRLIARGRLRIA